MHGDVAVPAGHRPLVLVADDEADIRSLVALRLERAGYDVIQAADGEEALRLAAGCRTRRAPRTRRWCRRLREEPFSPQELRRRVEEILGR